MAGTDAVIDKSFLQGALHNRLRSLFEDHRVLMTESLFHELLTTDPAVRACCFQKLPQTENPLILVKNVGAILQWEVENQRALSNINEVIIRERFQFNPGLINKEFTLPEREAGALDRWKMDITVRVREFAYHCSQVPVRFPELKGYRPGTPSTRIDRIKNRVCTDQGFVRELYSGGDGGIWPTKEQIDERWAIYRWLQIRVVAALDYFRKYGDRDFSSATTKVENEYLDLEYCLVGCLVGAIATKDSGMSERFLAILPSGKVLQ